MGGIRLVHKKVIRNGRKGVVCSFSNFISFVIFEVDDHENCDLHFFYMDLTGQKQISMDFFLESCNVWIILQCKTRSYVCRRRSKVSICLICLKFFSVVLFFDIFKCWFAL